MGWRQTFSVAASALGSVNPLPAPWGNYNFSTLMRSNGVQIYPANNTDNAGSYYGTGSFNADQYAEVIWSGTSIGNDGPLVRGTKVTTTRTFYMWGLSNISGWKYTNYRCEAGSFTAIGTRVCSNTDFTAHWYGLYAQGGQVWCTLDGVIEGAVIEDANIDGEGGGSGSAPGVNGYDTNPDGMATVRGGHWVDTTTFSKGRIVNEFGSGGMTRSSVVNSGGQ